MKKSAYFLPSLLLLCCLTTAHANTGYEQVVKQDERIYLNYNDLVKLSTNPSPSAEIFDKVEAQLNTPLFQQAPDSQTRFLHNTALGDFFRAAAWNIERGFNIEKVEKALQSFFPKPISELHREFNAISGASIIVLNEVDIGLPRTHYQNIAKRLANTLMAGYVFGTEFIELDPYQLGIKKFSKEERTFLETEALKQLDNIDKEKFKGLHGNAIISKYPILNHRIIRLPECYNWYEEEAKKISALEKVRRGTAKGVFSEKVLTELRYGGRIGVVADILLPNNEKITVVAAHLENRCVPKCRYKQLNFLLNRLRNIRNPVILAGDFNTTGTDASPVSIKKEALKRVKDPEFLAKQALLYLTPVSLIQNVVLNLTNSLRKFKDPTTKNIPLILPNKERKLFDLIREFRFNDGVAFDVRGIKEKSYLGNSGYFSNSNERETKGFKPTFQLQRHFGVAKYKLDWIFVKPLDLKNSNDQNGSYAYAPHFGRTLSLVNKAFGEKISDHDPVTVDIPINEPKSQ